MSSEVHPATAPPYRDPSRPLEERLEDLLARMTLPEKVGQMLQLDARGDLEDARAHARCRRAGGSHQAGHTAACR
jgi:hypothetical protein